MAVIDLLMIGIPYTLVADIVYAMPTRIVLVHVQQAGGTIEISNDNSTWSAVTLDTSEQFENAGGFIRALTTNAVVVLRAA